MAIGDLIGQYRLVEQIGEGGMGAVYLGEHTLLGRRAAIKTLLPKHAVHAELVERFFNEARAASAISDPGVIQIFDFGYHTDGSAYIVMEFLDGESLSDRIELLGKLPLGEALRIARQVAGSLQAAHAHAIVHRDLKPENIFLVADHEAQGGERTKILDFGICKVTDHSNDGSLTDVGTTVGTPAYMAPEQCRGLRDVDHRADIYAFGCLVFHMLTGRTPFEANAPGEFLVAHLRDVPPAPSTYAADLPPEVDALVLRCLAKAPGARFQTMAELQHAIGDVAAHLGLSAGGTPPSTRTLDMPTSEPAIEIAEVDLEAIDDADVAPEPAALPAALPAAPARSAPRAAAIAAASSLADPIAMPSRRYLRRSVLAIAGAALAATAAAIFLFVGGDADDVSAAAIPLPALPAIVEPAPAAPPAPPAPIVAQPTAPDPAPAPAAEPTTEIAKPIAPTSSHRPITTPRSARVAHNPASAPAAVSAVLHRTTATPTEDLYDTR